MRTRLTLKPGQNGTKRLLEEHGERLVCVRYRYDPATGRRVKTAEIIVEETTPDARCGAAVVGVRVEWHETALRDKAKRAGGRWNAKAKLWEIEHARALESGFGDRIVTSGKNL